MGDAFRCLMTYVLYKGEVTKEKGILVGMGPAGIFFCFFNYRFSACCDEMDYNNSMRLKY